MRVAFIVGPAGKAYIDTYNDTFKITNSRPWLKDVPRSLVVNENGTKKLPREYVRIDHAVAHCIKYFLRKSKTIKFLIVPADKVDGSLIRTSDFIFWHFYDKLVRPAPAVLSYKREPNGKYQKLIDSGGSKMFPPIKYQHMVYDKCAYYKFFEKNGINTAPTICLTRKQWVKSPKKSVDLVWTKSQIWKQTFGKPVHGTDSGDVGRPWDLDTRSKVEDYIRNVFSNPNRYPSIVFQKFMKDFELTFPQIRMYYLGNTYQYSVVEWKSPLPNGTSRLADARDAVFIRKAKRFASKVLKTVGPFYKGSPKFLTRIDVGCCMNDGIITNPNLFLNELEVLAGLYLFYDGEKRQSFDVKMAKQAIKVINYHKKNIATK